MNLRNLTLFPLFVISASINCVVGIIVLPFATVKLKYILLFKISSCLAVREDGSKINTKMNTKIKDPQTIIIMVAGLYHFHRIID